MPFFARSRHGARLRKDAVREFGLHRVKAALADGSVLSPWRGVLVDRRRAADPLTILDAAQLTVGPQSVLTGASAAFLHGITALPPTPVHLVVPYEAASRSRSGIVVHNGTFIDRDREERSGLPVFGLERVVADLACCVRPGDALAVIDEALASVSVAARRGVRRRVRDLITQRPDPRGRRIGTQLVDLATGRAESPSESWLLWMVVDLGFPVPEANLPIVDLDGRELYRVDLGWRTLRIAVEYNGYAAHAGRGEYDEHRRRDLEKRGWIVVVVEADDLRDGSRLEKELDAAFIARGVDVRGRSVGALRPRRHRDLGSRR